MVSTRRSVMLVSLILLARTPLNAIGDVALNSTDSVVGESVLRYDTSGNPLTAYASVGLDIFTSLDFDATTGILYGVHVDADNGTNGLFLASWAPDGTLLSNVSLGVSSVDIDSNAGSDIAVHNGLVALNPTDSGVNGSVLRFDTSGNPLSTFDPVGAGIVVSVDFDAITGILYGLHVDSDNGNNGLYLAAWSAA